MGVRYYGSYCGRQRSKPGSELSFEMAMTRSIVRTKPHLKCNRCQRRTREYLSNGSKTDLNMYAYLMFINGAG